MQISSSYTTLPSNTLPSSDFVCDFCRLPKAKHGKTLPVYWALERVAVQHIRLESITSRVFYRSNANSIAAVSIRVQLFNRLKLVQRKRLQSQHQFHHQDQVIHKIHFHRLDQVVQVSMAITLILDNIQHLHQRDKNTALQCRDHHRKRMHKLLIHQVNIAQL